MLVSALFVTFRNKQNTGAVTQAPISDLVVDLRALAECNQDMAMGNLAMGRHMAVARTLAPPSTPGPSARQKKVARGHSQCAEESYRRLNSSEDAWGV